MGEATEKEMIERLVDGTRDAADRVQEMCRSMMLHAPYEPRLLIRLRHSLRQASGSAHQLGHAQRNPAFFDLRDQLDAVAINVSNAALSHSPMAGVVMAKIGEALDMLWKHGRKIATSLSVPDQEVLAMVDQRQATVH